MALGPFSEADPLDAARIAAETAAEPAARLRTQRPPPIWIDRPRGSYRGAALLGALCVLGTALLLYDLELVGRAALVPRAGSITLVSRMREVEGWAWIEVRYDSEDALLMVETPDLPYVGAPVVVMTHTQYFRTHVHSVLTEGSRTPLFLEPPHTLGINGLVGMVGAVLSGVAAIVQWRLARSQARRIRDWLDTRTPR